MFHVIKILKTVIGLEVRAAALAVFAALVSSSAATHQLAELRTLLHRPQPNSLLGTPTTPAQTVSYNNFLYLSINYFCDHSRL